MSEVRIFRVPNKLRDKILKSGGPRALEILARAEKAMVEMRPPCLDIIDELIAEIVAKYGRANRKGDEDFALLYALSSRIIDVSAPVAELEIDRAAFFLCELVDRCSARDLWDWPSVDVHIDALQLLRLDRGNLPPAARLQIFVGLKKINNKLRSREEIEGAEVAGAAEVAETPAGPADA
jgi:hypothetical protein